MSRGILALLLLPWALAGCQTSPPAPPAPTHAEIVGGELSQLLAADQPTCGAVQLYSRRGRLDYRVECASGQVYRVHVRADGRVLIIPHIGD